VFNTVAMEERLCDSLHTLCMSCRLCQFTLEGASLLTTLTAADTAVFFPTSSTSPYLTRRQVATYLNVSEKWLAQSGRARGPAFHKFGGNCRYHVDDVNSWAHQQRVSKSRGGW
jgi:hypothetical protein